MPRMAPSITSFESTDPAARDWTRLSSCENVPSVSVPRSGRARDLWPRNAPAALPASTKTAPARIVRLLTRDLLMNALRHYSAPSGACKGNHPHGVKIPAMFGSIGGPELIVIFVVA